MRRSVDDRDSFIAFVKALADEREEADEIEKLNPHAFCVDGAKGWKNADIASFLYAALDYFDRHPNTPPSWRMMADFLYFGKIIE